MDSLSKQYREYKHSLLWNGSSAEEPRLDAAQARRLLADSKAWMIRNIYDWDCAEATEFWEIICDRNYAIEELPSKSRNQIRRSLRDCEVRRLNNRELVEADGYQVYARAFERYHDVTSGPIERQLWENQTLSDGVSEYWGVFLRESGKLIAWGLATVTGSGVNYNTLKAIPELMNRHYPYFGLLYTMNRHYMGERGFDYVTDGYRSITEHSNIQPFLEKHFLFRKAYCRVDIHYRLWMRLMINFLYPFRRLIPITSLRHLLRFEQIARS